MRDLSTRFCLCAALLLTALAAPGCIDADDEELVLDDEQMLAAERCDLDRDLDDGDFRCVPARDGRIGVWALRDRLDRDADRCPDRDDRLLERVGRRCYSIGRRAGDDRPRSCAEARCGDDGVCMLSRTGRPYCAYRPDVRCDRDDHCSERLCFRADRRCAWFAERR